MASGSFDSRAVWQPVRLTAGLFDSRFVWQANFLTVELFCSLFVEICRILTRACKLCGICVIIAHCAH